ncbi:MAG: inositol-3-phosphate synthase [Pseudomonadota bacterium]
MIPDKANPPLLLLVAGIQGAVGSTVAAAVTALEAAPQRVTPYLTTAEAFTGLGPLAGMRVAGWDTRPIPFRDCIAARGVVPKDSIAILGQRLDRIPVKTAPETEAGMSAQVARLRADIRQFMADAGTARAVLVNLLPAACDPDFTACAGPEDIDPAAAAQLPDLAYVAAAVREGVPVVNFTPNTVELPWVLAEAASRGVPVAGRDGKTGQTFLKVVLASAFRARNLAVDGWYSTNILGNADGRNLMDPGRCSGKLANKTHLLNEVLGYRVENDAGEPTHTVRIDYYPPRGDAKEAWDVIDLKGLFDMPMSIRINLQGRDSILAAPMVVDLARWVAALKDAGIGGAVPDLGFFFKKPVGQRPPVTFQEQTARLAALGARCGF